jgi:hypothetical protein
MIVRLEDEEALLTRTDSGISREAIAIPLAATTLGSVRTDSFHD